MLNTAFFFAMQFIKKLAYWIDTDRKAPQPWRWAKRRRSVDSKSASTSTTWNLAFLLGRLRRREVFYLWIAHVFVCKQIRLQMVNNRCILESAASSPMSYFWMLGAARPRKMTNGIADPELENTGGWLKQPKLLTFLSKDWLPVAGTPRTTSVKDVGRSVFFFFFSETSPSSSHPVSRSFMWSGDLCKRLAFGCPYKLRLCFFVIYFHIMSYTEPSAGEARVSLLGLNNWTGCSAQLGGGIFSPGSQSHGGRRWERCLQASGKHQ